MNNNKYKVYKNVESLRLIRLRRLKYSASIIASPIQASNLHICFQIHFSFFFIRTFVSVLRAFFHSSSPFLSHCIIFDLDSLSHFTYQVSLFLFTNYITLLCTLQNISSRLQGRL